MYQHWYVAHINQLSTTETAVFLSSLELLENEALPNELRECALSELNQQFDLNLQVYALPSLIQAALSEQPGSALSGQAVHLIQKICKMTENKSAASFSQSLKNREKLTVLLQDYNIASNNSGQLSESDYMELIPRADQVMAFGIIGHLTTEEVNAVLEGSNKWTSLLRKAVDGKFGRYILTLAAKAISRHNISLSGLSPDKLMPSFECVYYAQPDMLSAWLNLRTAQMCSEEYLNQESPYLFVKAAKNKPACDAAAWLFRGRDNADIKDYEYTGAFRHLWNYSLWLLAVRCSIREGTLTALVNELEVSWKKQRCQDRDSPLTPWVYRKYPRYDKKSNIFANNPEYPSIKELETMVRESAQTGAMKVALAMPVLALMISNLGEAVPEFLGDLSLNLHDVLAGPGVRSYIDKGYYVLPTKSKNRVREYSLSVISLLAYGKSLTDQIGKGYYNPFIPKLYTDLVERKALQIFQKKQTTLDDQELFLHSGASVMACANLAYEEATGTIPVAQKKRLWMDGGKDSLAAKICRIALNEFCSFINSSQIYRGTKPDRLLEKPVFLAYEHFPDLVTAKVKANLCLRDWLYRSNFLHDNIYKVEILLNDYSAKTWRETLIHKKFPKDRSRGEKTIEDKYSATLMALILKLSSVLHYSEDLTREDYAELEAWGEIGTSLYKKEEFSRIHRYLSVKLLETLLSSGAFEKIFPQVSDLRATDARDVAQVTVEAIVDLSRDAVFYQYAVGEAIANSQMQQHATLNNLKCVYFSMLLDQSLTAAENERTLLFPHARMEQRETSESRSRMLLWFIHKISPQIRKEVLFRKKLIEIVECTQKRTQNENSTMLTVKIFADKIIAEDGVLFDKKDWGEDNNYWDPDTLQCARRVERSLPIKVPAVKQEDKWLPLEREYLVFLLEQAYTGENVNETIKMTLIEADDKGILISTSPGQNYRLSTEYWDQGSFSKLLEEIDQVLEDYETTSPYGLNLEVTVIEKDGIPFLQFEQLNADNLQYRVLFQPGNSYSLEELQKLKNQYDFLKCSYASGFDYFCLDSWDIISRRTGVVKFKSDEAWRSLTLKEGEQEADIIRRLLNFRRNQIITLGSINHRMIEGLREPSVMPAFTKEGVELWVDSDSIALDHYAIYKAVDEAKVILTAAPRHERSNGNGVIWKIHSGTKQALVKYLDDEGGVRDIEINSKILGVRGAYCGLPVRVQNGKVEYLVDSKKAMKMIARRLWDIEKKCGQAFVGYGQVYIGEYHLADSELPVYLVQDFMKGKLFAYEKPTVAAPKNTCGIEISSYKIDVTKFSRPGNTVVAKCKQGNKVYYGEVDYGEVEQGEGSSVRCESISVRLEEYQDSLTGKILYDVRRIFSDLVPDSKQAASSVSSTLTDLNNKSLSKRRAQFYFNDFQAWKTDPEPYLHELHVEGKIYSKNGLWFQSESPLRYLPVDTAKPSDEDMSQWKCDIPVRPDGFVVPQHLKGKSAYARIKWTGGIGAYLDEAEEFSLGHFQKWLIKKYGIHQEYNRSLYYVKSQNGKLTFEWGAGFRLTLDVERFIISNSKNPENLLFYGDEIRKYRINTIKGSLCLIVRSMDDCTLSFDHRMNDFRKKGGKPFVKVSYDKETNKVTIESITNKKGEAEFESAGFEFYNRPAGFLDKETEEYIRTQLPDGGRGYFLAKSEWDASSLRMRYSLAEVEAGNILCLQGGRIGQYPGGNDYYVPFSPPYPEEEKALGSNVPSKIHVKRRSFSYRESTLRVYFVQGNLDVFNNRLMFVKIRQDQNTGRLLDDDIKSLLVRNANKVKEWLISEKTPQYVIIGRSKQDYENQDEVKVEIRPGIFCMAKKGKGEFESGATGKLYLDANNNVCVDVISDSDNRFCNPGRVVELLLINKTVLDDPDKPHFTVAGLPQIQLSNQALGQALIKCEPPRYGMLKGSRKVEGCEPFYGYVKVTENNGERQISLSKGKNNEPVEDVPVHKLSFYDGSVLELQKHILRGRWHYHDLKTIYETGDECVPRFYKVNSHLPVLFNSEWSLRYKESELMRYAFPPHELEEFGIPSEEDPLDNYYPIAGKDKDSIFVELLPGRVVKLPLKLLRLDFKVNADEVLHTDSFAAGDMIKLATREREAGKPLEISIIDVKYGLRSFVRNSAYLKVKDWETGCITLGSNAFQLRYPSLQQKPECIPEAMCLTPENELQKLSGNVFPKTGDLVSVEVDKTNCLRAVGFRDAVVDLSKSGTSSWKNGFWLENLLSQPKSRQEMLSIFGGMLLMRVEYADSNKKRIEVSYPQPEAPIIGETVCAQMIGRLDKSSTLLFRAGMRLIMLDMEYLVNVPSDLAKEILDRKPIVPGNTLWIRYCGDNSSADREFKTGFDEEEKDTFEVRPFLSVDSESGRGYLCENTRNHEWIWLPLEHVARAEKATAKSVVMVLREFYCDQASINSNEYPVLSVKLDSKTGFASWLAANDFFQTKFSELRCDDSENPISVRIAAKLNSSSNGGNIYLCYERPRGNIYQLRSETEQIPTDSASFVSAFCTKKTDTCAELIPVNEKRTTLRLSHYMLESFSVGYNPGERAINKWDDIDARYPDLDEEETFFKTCNEVIKFDAEKVDEKDPRYKKLLNQVNQLLCEYKNSIEQRSSKDDIPDIPVYLALTLAIFASKTHPKIGDNIYQILNEDASFYCCEEILLRKWLLLKGGFGKNNLRRILGKLNLRGFLLNSDNTNNNFLGKLTPGQLRNLVQATDTILRRNRINESSDISQLALSLRYAVDQKESAVLKAAWNECHCSRFYKFDSLKDLMRTENHEDSNKSDSLKEMSTENHKDFIEWYSDFRSRELCHICVQDPKEIIVALSQLQD